MEEATTVPPGLKTSALLPLPQYHLVSKLLPYHLYHSTIWSQNLCLITSQNLSVQLFVHVSWFEVRNYRVIFCLINLVSLLSIFVHAADVIMTSLQYSVTVPAKCLALCWTTCHCCFHSLLNAWHCIEQHVTIASIHWWHLYDSKHVFMLKTDTLNTCCELES